MKQQIENIIKENLPEKTEIYPINVEKQDEKWNYLNGFNQALSQINTSLIADEVLKVVKVTENTSDGYHTFKELYEYRKLYNAGLFNEWAKQGLFNVHKSERHSDGEFCFDGGWFIVVATLPTGDISNHYEMSDWDLFNCEIREKAKEWDGHTPQDVAKRLNDFLLSTLSPNKENEIEEIHLFNGTMDKLNNLNK